MSTTGQKHFETVPLATIDRCFGWAARQTRNPTDMDFGAIMHVGGPAPTIDALREFVAERVERAPVLGYRLGRHQDCWEPASSFDPHSHVHAYDVPPGTETTVSVLDALRRPLPPDRPLWDLTMLRGQDDDEYILCYRVPHIFQDGMSMAATLEALFGRRRLPSPPSPAPFKGDRRHRRSWGWPPVDLAIPLRRGPDWPPGGQRLTGHQRLHLIELDGSQIRAIAQVTGATRNQVCLAALTEATRTWAPEGQYWRRHHGPAVVMPLSLRPQDPGAALGNHLGVLPVTLPCRLSSPVDQLRHVMAQTDTNRIERHRARNRIAVRITPYPLMRMLFSRIGDPRYVAAITTTVRVAPELTVADAPVRKVAFYPPLGPNSHLVVGIVQHGPQMTVSLLVDAAFPRPDQLGALLHQATTRLYDLTAADVHS